MADTLMPDSLVSMAAQATPTFSQAQQDSTIGQDDASSQDDSQAASGELQTLEKRLADTQNALKQAQAEFHQTKGQLAQLSQQVNAPREEAKDADILADEGFLKRFDDDPAKGLVEALGHERDRLAKAFVTIMDQRDKDMEARLGSQLTMAPDKQAYSRELSELSKSVEGFSALPDTTKIQLAKQIRAARPADSLSPPGNPAGTGMSTAQRQTDDEAYRKRVEAMKMQMFGPAPIQGAEAYPTVGNIGSQFRPNGAKR